MFWKYLQGFTTTVIPPYIQWEMLAFSYIRLCRQNIKFNPDPCHQYILNLNLRRSANEHGGALDFYELLAWSSVFSPGYWGTQLPCFFPEKAL